jgi:hypothetical protein
MPEKRIRVNIRVAIVNKKKLVEKILDKLADEMELYYKAAKASHEEATHEQNKAENKYDTRGLEAAYLAGGQAKQAAETELTIKEFRKLVLKPFGAKDPIDLSAVVELQSPAETNFYFIASRGGGIEVQVGKKQIFVITPKSPLGQQLMGKTAGEKLSIKLGPATEKYLIAAVA